MSHLKEFWVDNFDRPTKVKANGVDNQDVKDPFPDDTDFEDAEVHTILVMRSKHVKTDSQDPSKMVCRWYWICVGGRYFKVCM